MFVNWSGKHNSNNFSGQKMDFHFRRKSEKLALMQSMILEQTFWKSLLTFLVFLRYKLSADRVCRQSLAFKSFYEKEKEQKEYKKRKTSCI